MLHRQAHAIHACREEQRVAEAEQAGIAKEDVVSHGEAGQHHDPCEIAVVIGGQHEMQRQQHRQQAQMQRQRPHAARFPNRPCGRNTRTSATSSVAMILASVGEKKTEMIPSLSAISTAASTVPGRLPNPPMMTTMNDSKSGSAPIR